MTWRPCCCTSLEVLRGRDNATSQRSYRDSNPHQYCAYYQLSYPRPLNKPVPDWVDYSLFVFCLVCLFYFVLKQADWESLYQNHLQFTFNEFTIWIVVSECDIRRPCSNCYLLFSVCKHDLYLDCLTAFYWRLCTHSRRQTRHWQLWNG